MSKEKNKYGINTKSVRFGQVRTHENEHSEPMFITSSFVFSNAAEAAELFKGDKSGNIYSRFTNPTVRCFEDRLASMEGGERCIATSSGMSAILSILLGLLKCGDHVVSSRSIFGTTVNLFSKLLPKYKIQSTFVDLVDYAAWEKSIKPNTKVLFLETPSNPLTEIADINKLANIAHTKNCLLVVDNCFCTPVLQRPLMLGADIVIHSATKYIDGQGRCLGGAIVGSESLLGEEIYNILRTGGVSMSPFNAWVFTKGLETLAIRMKAHSKNARKIAKWLVKQSFVNKVYYPGLKSHPQHKLANKQQSDSGGIVSFEINGGLKTTWKFIDTVKIFSITANLGDTKSTITHPATTTHNKLTEKQREKSGIKPNLIRLSIGLEDYKDLIFDLTQAAR